MSNARAVLEKSKPFNEFDEATLDRFVADARTQEFSSGDVLFHELSEGEEIYFILAGEIRISVELASAHHMAEEIGGGPGELVGEGCFITDGPRPATVTATTDVTALVWNVADWKSIAQEDPRTGYQLAVYADKVLFERVGRLRDHLINDISWGLE